MRLSYLPCVRIGQDGLALPVWAQRRAEPAVLQLYLSIGRQCWVITVYLSTLAAGAQAPALLRLSEAGCNQQTAWSGRGSMASHEQQSL